MTRFDNLSEEEMKFLLMIINNSQNLWSPIKVRLKEELTRAYNKKFNELRCGIGGGE